jgi:histone H3/H4
MPKAKKAQGEKKVRYKKDGTPFKTRKSKTENDFITRPALRKLLVVHFSFADRVQQAALDELITSTALFLREIIAAAYSRTKGADRKTLKLVDFIGSPCQFSKLNTTFDELVSMAQSATDHVPRETSGVSTAPFTAFIKTEVGNKVKVSKPVTLFIKYLAVQYIFTLGVYCEQLLNSTGTKTLSSPILKSAKDILKSNEVFSLQAKRTRAPVHKVVLGGAKIKKAVAKAAGKKATGAKRGRKPKKAAETSSDDNSSESTETKTTKKPRAAKKAKAAKAARTKGTPSNVASFQKL